MERTVLSHEQTTDAVKPFGLTTETWPKSTVEVQMSTKVFLSGAEVPRFFDCMKAMKCKSVLMTYYSLRKNPDYLKKRKDKNPEIDVFVDSGAFTLMMKSSMSESDAKRYLEDYIEFLEAHKQYVFCAAELDIDTVIGKELPEQWRNTVFKEMNKKVPIIYVWHDAHGMDQWKEYCAKNSFVGISSDYKLGRYQAALQVARSYLTKVHIFGYTRSTEIQNFDFFSVDSTTWLLGSKYGESVSGDTRVLIRDRFGIRNLPIKKVNIRPDSETMSCVNGIPTWTPVTQLVCHKSKQRLFGIRFSDGQYLKVTEGHSLFKCDKHGRLTECAAGTLQEQDWVVTPRLSRSAWNKTDNQAFTDNFLRFCGLWLGDGCYEVSGRNVNGVMVCTHSPEAGQVVLNVAAQFGAETSKRKNASVSESYWEIRMHSRGFAEYLYSVLGLKGDSETKRFPSFMWLLSKRQLALVLQGLWEADGSASNNRFTTVSEGLHQDVLLALSLLGIRGTYSCSENVIHGKKTGLLSHGIAINDCSNACRFLRKAGFLDRFKINKSKAFIRGKQARGPYRENIPVVLLKNGKICLQKTSVKWDWETPSRTQKGISKHNKGFFKTLRDCNYAFLRVHSIEELPKEKYVYDLCVPGPQNFMANGVLAHNTDIFNGRTILRYDNTKKAMRQRYRNKLENAGLNWDRINSENYYEVIKMNMLAFIEMEEYLARVNRNKAYWHLRLPNPAKIKQFPMGQVDAELIKHKNTPEVIKAMDENTRRERLVLYSMIQNGWVKSLRKYFANEPKEGIEADLGSHAAHVPDKDNPTDAQLDALRRSYNMSLLGSEQALTRDSIKDYIPSKPVKKRAQEPPEWASSVDLEGVDLFYGEENGVS